MAAVTPQAPSTLPQPDFAFFEVFQDSGNKLMHYVRIASPKDRRSLNSAVAYFDANLLEDALKKDPTKVTRSPIPGDWALKEILGDAAVDAYTHFNDYTVKYV